MLYSLPGLRDLLQLWFAMSPVSHNIPVPVLSPLCNKVLWPKASQGRKRFIWFILKTIYSLSLREVSQKLKLKPRTLLAGSITGSCLTAFLGNDATHSVLDLPLSVNNWDRLPKICPQVTAIWVIPHWDFAGDSWMCQNDNEVTWDNSSSCFLGMLIVVLFLPEKGELWMLRGHASELSL